VIYLATDRFAARDLRRAVALGTELSRAGDSQPRVWLFDEVTGVPGWTTEIKALRDGTRFGDDTVILTGSSMESAEQAVRDLGAGRAGESNVSPFRTLLPMTFRSVLEVTAKELAVIDHVPPSRLQSDDVATRLASLDPIVDALDLAWQRYLESGGFPRAVAEYHRDGAVSPAFMESLASWLTADVEPAAPPDSVALLIAELHDRCAAPLNVRATASALGYSRDQMTARLSRLVRSYAGIWCHQVDDRGRRIAKAQGKFYLTDPVLNWLGHRLRPGVTQPDFTRLTEAAIGIALARAIAAGRLDRWSAGDTIGYSKTDSRKEIDFAPVAVATAGGQQMTKAVEAKWVTDGWRSEARAIEGKYRSGIVATKNILDLSYPAWAVPAPVIALLLG
jgi:hypothetical protein